MKQICSIIILVSCLCVSCKKETATKGNNTPSIHSGLLASIEYNHSIDSFFYNPLKQLTEVRIYSKSSNQVERQIFTYSNNNIQSIQIGNASLSYSYPNNTTTRIELSLFGTGADYRMLFINENNKLKEYIQLSLATGLPIPYERNTYTYNDKGNIVKEEVFEHDGGKWEKVEEVFISYDNKPNTSARHEFSAYIINDDILANNPLKIERKSSNGTLLETSIYSYEYDTSNRKTKANIVHTTIGQSTETETIVYKYYH